MNETDDQLRVLELLPDFQAGKLDPADQAWLEQQLADSPEARASAGLHKALVTYQQQELDAAVASRVPGQAAAVIAKAGLIRAEQLQQRFLELLPDYSAGALSNPEREEVDAELANSQWARAALAQHRALADLQASEVARTDVAAGYTKVMSRITAARGAAVAESTVPTAGATTPDEPRTPRPPPTPPRKPSVGLGARLAQWLGTLVPQRLAPVFLVLMALEGGLLGWQHLELRQARDQMRAAGGYEVVKSLRVRFVATASSEQITQALVSAGARVVGGPSQFGEYWLTSLTHSQQEMGDILMSSGLLEGTAEVDQKGPPTQ